MVNLWVNECKEIKPVDSTKSLVHLHGKNLNFILLLLFSSFLKSVDRFPVCSPEIKLVKKLPTWLFSKMFFIDTFHKIRYSTSKLYLDEDHLFLVTLCSNAVHHPLMSRCPLSSTCPNITSVSSLSHVLLLPVLLSSHTWASPFSCHLTSQCLQLSKNQYLWIKK